jgi:hypothetical protein
MLTAEQKKIGQAWYLSQPGKRGIDIPAETYDKMRAVADGITIPMWGRRLLPAQMQHLYENHQTEPYQIHAAIGQLPHPHAPNVKVSEYPHYVSAFQTYQEHSK